MKMSINAYKKLINDDVKWLVENTENSLEREHIIKILWESIPEQLTDCDIFNGDDGCHVWCPGCETICNSYKSFGGSPAQEKSNTTRWRPWKTNTNT